jgi:hypothetical protein
VRWPGRKAGRDDVWIRQHLDIKKKHINFLSTSYEMALYFHNRTAAEECWARNELKRNGFDGGSGRQIAWEKKLFRCAPRVREKIAHRIAFTRQKLSRDSSSSPPSLHQGALFDMCAVRIMLGRPNPCARFGGFHQDLHVYQRLHIR